MTTRREQWERAKREARAWGRANPLVAFDPLDRSGWVTQEDATLLEALELRAHGGKKWSERAYAITAGNILVVCPKPCDLFNLFGFNASAQNAPLLFVQVWDAQSASGLVHDRPVAVVPVDSVDRSRQWTLPPIPRGFYEFTYGVVLTASTTPFVWTPNVGALIGVHFEFQEFDLENTEKWMPETAVDRQRAVAPELWPDFPDYHDVETFEVPIDNEDLPDDERSVDYPDDFYK